MVVGLDKFAEHFADYKDCYILIGGSASDLVFEDAGLEFRATKDLDIVLCFEALTKEFVVEFWGFVQAGNYERRETSSGKKQFYRFQNPKAEGFPHMLELFSRNPDILSVEYEGHLTPIPVDEDVSSLSAILLDDKYYAFLHAHKKELEGVSIVSEVCLIPLKARAWLDLSHRKNAGEDVKSDDIKKHRNDILRLFQLLDRSRSIELPAAIEADIAEFLTAVEGEITPQLLKSLKLSGLSPEQFFEQLRRFFGIA